MDSTDYGVSVLNGGKVDGSIILYIINGIVALVSVQTYAVSRWLGTCSDLVRYYTVIL